MTDLAAPSVPNVGKSRHPAVPSSNAPPIPEWTTPYWYFIRCTGLQAHKGISDRAAQHLVNTMEALATTLPCPECRGHFEEDWADEPYTLEHARSTELSFAWVQGLKARTDHRVSLKRAATEVAAAKAQAAPPLPAPIAAFSGAGAGATSQPSEPAKEKPQARPAIEKPAPTKTATRPGAELIPQRLGTRTGGAPLLGHFGRFRPMTGNEGKPRGNPIPSAVGLAAKTALLNAKGNHEGYRVVGCATCNRNRNPAPPAAR